MSVKRLNELRKTNADEFWKYLPVAFETSAYHADIKNIKTFEECVAWCEKCIDMDAHAGLIVKGHCRIIFDFESDLLAFTLAHGDAIDRHLVRGRG